VLGFWMKEGLLVPMPSDSRKHRRFAFDQLHIAVVLNAMRSLGANIGVLRKFSSQMQRGREVFSASGLEYDQVQYAIFLVRALNRFRRGEPVQVYNEEWLDAPGDTHRNFDANRLARDEADIEQDWLRSNGREADLPPAIPFARQLDDADALCVAAYLELIQPDFIGWRHPSYNFVWVAWLADDGAPAILSGVDANFGGTPPTAAFFISISKLIRPLWVSPEQHTADLAKCEAWRREKWG
jgi:DNA-binding transcriptional MerR regulator